jgi:CubicO group peptidase (beta-lactamase class C family)
LDASGGSASRNLRGAAKGALIRAAASTLTFDVYLREPAHRVKIREVGEMDCPATFSQPITFANLLTHTSGLDEISPGRHTSNKSEIVPLGTFLRSRIVRQFPPGEIIYYSTYNSSLAALIIEEMTGTSFKTYLQKSIFSPLRMSRTSITEVSKEHQQDLATGYVYRENKYQKLPFEWFNTYPASDINSTATDMARFMIANLQYGTIGGRRILSTK